MAGAWVTSFSSGQMVEPDLVSFLKFCRIGQVLIVGVYPVGDRLQVLTGVVLDTM
jgi:hypothetical protein